MAIFDFFTKKLATVYKLENQERIFYPIPPNRASHAGKPQSAAGVDVSGLLRMTSS